MGGAEESGFDRLARVLRVHQNIHTLFVLCMLFFSFVFVACSKPQEGKLEERVKEFWDARVAGDDAKAYNYEAYSKTNKMTLQQYLQARNPALKYNAYEVKKVEEKGDEATVTVDIKYHLVIPTRADLNLSMETAEPWVRLDGQWYRQVLESKQNLS